MAIEIIKEGSVRLTEARRDDLLGRYQAEIRNWYCVTPPPTFESWLRSRGYGK